MERDTGPPNSWVVVRRTDPWSTQVGFPSGPSSNPVLLSCHPINRTRGRDGPVVPTDTGKYFPKTVRRLKGTGRRGTPDCPDSLGTPIIRIPYKDRERPNDSVR